MPMNMHLEKNNEGDQSRKETKSLCTTMKVCKERVCML